MQTHRANLKSNNYVGDMMKNYNLILCLLLSVPYWPAHAATLLTPKTILMPTRIIKPITPRNTLFLWDFHDVIVKRNLNKTIRTVWNSDKKLQIIKATNKNLFWNSLRIIGKSITSSTSSEEFIQVVKQNNNPMLEELIYEVANIQEPIPGTVQLIQQLHEIKAQLGFYAEIEVSFQVKGE